MKFGTVVLPCAEVAGEDGYGKGASRTWLALVDAGLLPLCRVGRSDD